MLPQHDRLIVTLDADLYSSTALVLDRLAPELRAGDIVYFDDFPMDEKSVASDFCSKYDRRLAPLAMDALGFHWVFTVID